MAATTALREALNQGISSGSLGDTKIILYSHRDSSGRVCRPKALYANSLVLRTVPYFKNRKSVPVPGDLRNRGSTVIIDTTHAGPHRVVLKVFLGNPVQPQSKDLSKETIDDEEYAEDYEYLSDSDLEDDKDEKVASFKPMGKSKVHLFDPFRVPGEDKIIPCEEHEERVEKGKIIKIPDMAFVT